MSTFSHILEWLDENRRRGFPLKEHVNNPDSALLLDAALISNSTADVTLSSIIVASGLCSIVTSLGTFTIITPITGASHTSMLANGSKLVVGSFINSMPTGTTTYTGVTFEPCVVTSYTQPWKGLQGLSFVADDGDILGPFTGDVDMVGRYYTDLSCKTNTLIWRIGKASGSALGPCATYKESTCGSQISSINGISPVNNTFRITTGAGLTLTQGANSLTMTVSFTESDICKAIPPTP